MVGIFGGSFDPVHFGHIKLAYALLDNYGFEQIRFVPCLQSPLKDQTLADATHRFEMLKIVTSANDKLVVDDRELKREGPSYTIDTLDEFRNEMGSNQTLVLFLGLDAYFDYCKWHKYDEILSFCHIMLLDRPGYSLPKKGCEHEIYKKNNTKNIEDLSGSPNGLIFLSRLLKIDISSTIIRSSISEGKQPRYLLPGSVWNYINKNKLYH